MEMTGEQLIPIDKNAVWIGLNDPVILKECIRGCDALDRISDVEYAISLVAAIGPIKAKFKGKMHITESDPPSSYALTFEMQGGMSGFGKGGAQVTLQERGADTLLSYRVETQLGGKLAQIGGRLINGVAKKMADEFFVAFSERMKTQPVVGSLP
jgi:carbon monoxide dehydrogenase subunit G